MIQKNYLCVYGVYCICVVHARVCRYASLYMHKQRQRASMTGISLSHFLPPCHEAASLSEPEAHSFCFGCLANEIAGPIYLYLSLTPVLRFLGLCNHAWILTYVLRF